MEADAAQLPVLAARLRIAARQMGLYRLALDTIAQTREQRAIQADDARVLQ